MNLRYPYQFDDRGRTAEADDPAYIRELIEQVLFTAPGERVMRPDFGSGLMQLLFAPNSAELAATTQFLVQGANTDGIVTFGATTSAALLRVAAPIVYVSFGENVRTQCLRARRVRGGRERQVRLV